MAVVPVGIDPCRFSTPDREQRRQDRAQLGIADEDVVFLSVALLRRIKGQDVLVRAFQRVHEHNPHARLILVGEGELHGELDSLIQQLGLASCARLTGFVDDVMPYFRAADVYVHPSRGDAGPYSPLEAMACSLPVISTSVGALPEIVEDGHTGILIPPDDPGAMALAMLSLAEDGEERRRMALAGSSRVIECFQLHDMILRTEKVYLHCLGLQEPKAIAAYASK
jgi:glycosyltransferase involved in cell wall biosynthesis